MKGINLLFVAYLITFNLAFGQDVKIDRIDPPFWWVGMKNTFLQLTIYGENIASMQPRITNEQVKISRSVKTSNPNYIFLNIEIAKNTHPGHFEIQFSKGDLNLTYNYELRERRSRSDRQMGLTQEDVVYLIMPDRFVNGDPGNDNIDSYPDKVNRNNPDGRHGGDLKGIIDRLDYLKELGITALWLTPFQENNMDKLSYHGYSITDHFKVDSRLGTNEDYVILVEEAHARGIKVVLDVVFNQVGKEHYFIKDLPMEDWIHQFDQFTRTNYESVSVLDIHASQYDRQLMTNGWFDVMMPDMNQSNPFVAQYLKQYVTWWVEYANLDAVRFDTYPYNDKNMLSDWALGIKEEYPDFFSFGEILIENIGPEITSYWQEKGHAQYESHLQGTVDFPIYFASINALKGEGTIRSLYNILAKDYLHFDPSNNVTLNGNHDVDRIHSLLGENINRTKMMAGILLTMRGIPQIYYGDEILMTGINDGTSDGPRRKDFPGGWAEDQNNLFEKNERKGQQEEYFNFLQQLLDWRKSNPNIINGQLTHFVPKDEVYVYFRHKRDDAAMIILNNNKQDKTLNLDRFVEILFKYSSAWDVLAEKELSLDTNLKLESESITILQLGANGRK